MKRFFTLICFVFVFCFAAISQDDVYFQPVSKYPKGSSKIIIETGKSKDENFKLCSSFLNDLNIVTELNDKTMVIQTDELNTKKRNYPYILNFFCKDSVIVMSGKFKTGMTIQIYGVRAEDNFIPIVNKGSKGSAYEVAFTEMVNMAIKFDRKFDFQ